MKFFFSDYSIIKKSGLFDSAYYLEVNPDVQAKQVDPLWHYVRYGWQEGRNPSPYFNTAYYLEHNPGISELKSNPFVHYIQHGQKEGFKPSKNYSGELDLRASDMTGSQPWKDAGTPGILNHLPGIRWIRKKIVVSIFILRTWGFRTFVQKVIEKLGNPQKKAKKIFPQREKAGEENPYRALYNETLAASINNKGREYVEFSAHQLELTPEQIKLIAFYLPQYHPFPENDAWWGRGFTEWTNVSKALPQFTGHDQPRLPGELGFYDLRVPEVQRRQVELARNYGIYGFCFHYYWFAGKRLLERPLDQFVSDPEIDFPFCVCWANENWTRAWDGRSNDILIQQEHSFDNDKLIIHDLVELFKNPRYIHVNGRPLFIVYRSDILKDVKDTIKYWRNYALDHGCGDPFILMAQTFDISDPRPDGFDGAVEFPPHNRVVIPEISKEQTFLNTDFKGKVYPYADLASTSSKRIKQEPYKRFNTVSPAWDNTSRRPNSGVIYTGSTPEIYARWLDAACRFAKNNKPEEERLVFINAWNEWGEAAYLEPDRRHGYAYLQSTFDVLDHLKLDAYLPESEPGKSSQVENSAVSVPQWVEHIRRTSPWSSPEGEDVAGSKNDETQKIAAAIDELLQGGNASETGSPLASIIIPVYNHFEETLNCLKSIGSVQEKTSYEIIVIDDGSTDATQAVLSNSRNIRYIRNEENLGFLRSCNKAAAAAGGDYLVLLNNDTMVLPGWLDALIDTYRSQPGTGLVGSKLLYPDGSLQEAGGVMWEDASGINFGRNDNPDLPQYNYLRDADYCSGASICVPRKVWDEMNGFDEMFAPAYYEDTDLAFRIRHAGYAVLYQPFSRVVHFEGVTSGTNVAEGVKHYQEINREKFYSRWKQELADHGSSLQHYVLYRNRVRRKRALVIDVCTPKPDQDSGSVDTYQYLMMLRKLGFEMTFISVVDADVVDRYAMDLMKNGIECIYGPYPVYISEYLKKMGRYLDLVMLFRAPYGGRFIDPVRKYAPQARVIFDTVDLHFLRETREKEVMGAKFSRHENGVGKDKELGIMKKSDATIVVSEHELKTLASLGISSRVRHIPLPREVPGRSTGFEDRKNIVFLGGYLHLPNVDAVKNFVQEIWPLVTPRLPDAEFWMAGSNLPDELKALAGEKIKAVGFVPDLDELFSQVKISIAPLRYGAGVKGKVISSLSYGVPCVATSIATEGMGLVDGENVLLGETPQDFADAVVRMYTDAQLWEKCSVNGLAFIQEHYSLQTFEKNLSALLAELEVLPKLK
ncbi:MAG: glycoside hydrolase family 99-like domain-containing protein [Anaerolineaceae bacterium]